MSLKRARTHAQQIHTYKPNGMQQVSIVEICNLRKDKKEVSYLHIFLWISSKYHHFLRLNFQKLTGEFWV